MDVGVKETRGFSGMHFLFIIHFLFDEQKNAQSRSEVTDDLHLV